jgi:hypothetical protein
MEVAVAQLRHRNNGPTGSNVPWSRPARGRPG